MGYALFSTTKTTLEVNSYSRWWMKALISCLVAHVQDDTVKTDTSHSCPPVHSKSVMVTLWPLVDETGTQQLHFFFGRLNADEQAAGSQNHSTPEWWRDLLKIICETSWSFFLLDLRISNTVSVYEEGQMWWRSAHVHTVTMFECSVSMFLISWFLLHFVQLTGRQFFSLGHTWRPLFV